MMSTTGLPAGATSGAGGVVFTGLGGGAVATAAAGKSKEGGAMTALDLGRSYGLAVVFAGLFAGFALVL
jgi:hypothetical protein